MLGFKQFYLHVDYFINQSLPSIQINFQFEPGVSQALEDVACLFSSPAFHAVRNQRTILGRLCKAILGLKVFVRQRQSIAELWNCKHTNPQRHLVKVDFLTAPAEEGRKSQEPDEKSIKIGPTMYRFYARVKYGKPLHIK
jgi:hypothetical protein